MAMTPLMCLVCSVLEEEIKGNLVGRIQTLWLKRNQDSNRVLTATEVEEIASRCLQSMRGAIEWSYDHQCPADVTRDNAMRAITARLHDELAGEFGPKAVIIAS